MARRPPRPGALTPHKAPPLIVSLREPEQAPAAGSGAPDPPAAGARAAAAEVRRRRECAQPGGRPGGPAWVPEVRGSRPGCPGGRRGVRAGSGSGAGKGRSPAGQPERVWPELEGETPRFFFLFSFFFLPEEGEGRFCGDWGDAKGGRASAAGAARGSSGSSPGSAGRRAGRKEVSGQEGPRPVCGTRHAGDGERPAATPGRPQLSAPGLRPACAAPAGARLGLAARPPRPGKEFEAFALFKLPVDSPED